MAARADVEVHEENTEDEVNVKANASPIEKDKKPSADKADKGAKEKPSLIYDWDQYFMSIACLAALASKDKHSPVRQ